MRISDWSSDVCSSDLVGGSGARVACIGARNLGLRWGWGRGCTCGVHWCPQPRAAVGLGAWVHVWRALMPRTHPADEREQAWSLMRDIARLAAPLTLTLTLTGRRPLVIVR